MLAYSELLWDVDELNEDTAGADQKLGELLGYPPCCIDFFCRASHRMIDGGLWNWNRTQSAIS